MQKFIVGPLRVTRIQTLIIIEAIDEHKDEESAFALLSVLSRYVHEIRGFKFFIIAWPEPQTQSGFRLPALEPITEVLKGCTTQNTPQSTTISSLESYLGS